jgi:protein-tyrosine phosphatase
LEKKFRIMFVCTGNTCRSPLAEIITKAEARKQRLRHISVTSAGTAAAAGQAAAQHAKTVAEVLGLSLARFRSRPLTRAKVRRADLILTMNRAQKEEITSRWPDTAHKAFVISEFSRSRRTGIEDPVGGERAVYMRCARMLTDEIKRILPRVESRRDEVDENRNG